MYVPGFELDQTITSFGVGGGRALLTSLNQLRLNFGAGNHRRVLIDDARPKIVTVSRCLVR